MGSTLGSTLVERNDMAASRRGAGYLDVGLALGRKEAFVNKRSAAESSSFLPIASLVRYGTKPVHPLGYGGRSASVLMGLDRRQGPSLFEILVVLGGLGITTAMCLRNLKSAMR